MSTREVSQAELVARLQRSLPQQQSSVTGRPVHGERQRVLLRVRIEGRDVITGDLHPAALEHAQRRRPKRWREIVDGKQRDVERLREHLVSGSVRHGEAELHVAAQRADVVGGRHVGHLAVVHLALREGLQGRGARVLRRQSIRRHDPTRVGRDGALQEEWLARDRVHEVRVVGLDVRVAQMRAGEHDDVRLAHAHATSGSRDGARRHVVHGGDGDARRVGRGPVRRAVAVAEHERERVREDLAAQVVIVHVTARDLELWELDDRVAERERPEAAHQFAGRGRALQHEHDAVGVGVPVMRTQHVTRDLHVTSFRHFQAEVVDEVGGAVVFWEDGDREADARALGAVRHVEHDVVTRVVAVVMVIDDVTGVDVCRREDNGRPTAELQSTVIQSTSHVHLQS